MIKNHCSVEESVICSSLLDASEATMTVTVAYYPNTALHYQAAVLLHRDQILCYHTLTEFLGICTLFAYLFFSQLFSFTLFFSKILTFYSLHFQNMPVTEDISCLSVGAKSPIYNTGQSKDS